MSSGKLEKGKWVRAHCHSCDWDGYTDNLDDACYGCGEYESLREVSGDENADANHFEFSGEKSLGFDDPNCCGECGGDLDQTGFCWECDF